MTIVEISHSKDDFHNTQTIYDVTPLTFPIPEGYALLPESVGTPETLESFPYGEITVSDMGGIPVVTSWTPGVKPEPQPIPPQPAPLDSQVKAISDRQDFLEDCIAEMATQVYA